MQLLQLKHFFGHIVLIDLFVGVITYRIGRLNFGNPFSSQSPLNSSSKGSGWDETSAVVQ